MPAPDRPAVLILGGTSEAVALADLLVERWGDDFRIVTSLAGRTTSPAGVRGEVRSGGFGGAPAMADYLRAHAVRAVIDATHPFAVRISGNARDACRAAGVPRIAFCRAPWHPEPGDRWHMQPNLSAAAAALPRFGRRAFLTVGRSELEAFAACGDMWFLVRMVEIPETPLPLGDCRVIAARGPFAAEAERELMEDHKIDVLVCKASGGEATRAKLVAARRLGIPVLMAERPPPPGGACAESLEETVRWTGRQLT